MSSARGVKVPCAWRLVRELVVAERDRLSMSSASRRLRRLRSLATATLSRRRPPNHDVTDGA